MNNTLKNIMLTAAVLSLTASAYASGGDPRSLLLELGNPAKSEELKTLVLTDSEAANALLAEALNAGNGPGYRCAAIEALGASADKNVTSGLAKTLNDPSPEVQACAIRAAGEGKNKAAVDALLSNVESYLASARSKGPYEDNLKARLKAIDSIWALGEIGSPQVMARLEKFYAASDDVIRMNLVVSMGKLEPNPHAAPYIRGVAASAGAAGFVRAAAFEMLEELGQNIPAAGLVPSAAAGIESGDIIYTGGRLGTIGSWLSTDLPIGHAGIFAGTEVKNGRVFVLIADCVPNNFIPPGVRNINSWKNFTHHFKYPYYGNRTSRIRPSREQRQAIVKLAREMGTKGLRYSDSHFSQKGPEEFDCVGYTEYLYEKAGLNPTDNSYETGLGWPLTPWEQFEATDVNAAPVIPYFTSSKTAAGAYTPRPAFGTLEKGLFGVSGEQIEINMDITPERAD